MHWVGWGEEEGEVFDKADLYPWFNHQFRQITWRSDPAPRSYPAHISNPQSGILARKLGGGEYGEIMGLGLAPHRLLLLRGQPRASLQVWTG